MGKSKLSKTEYNSLLSNIESFKQRHDLCKFDDQGKCLRMRLTKEPVSCCRSCPLLSKSGCTTNNIFCRHHYCNIAIAFASDEALNELIALQTSMEETYSGDILYFTEESVVKSKIVK